MGRIVSPGATGNNDEIFGVFDCACLSWLLSLPSRIIAPSGALIYEEQTNDANYEIWLHRRRQYQNLIRNH
jgi:hypothetical protein